MRKLWVCTTSEPTETLPPLPPAPCNRYPVKCVLLQSWRGLTVGRWLESPFSPGILPLLLSLSLHLMFSPLQDLFRLKHGCSQGFKLRLVALLGPLIVTHNIVCPYLQLLDGHSVPPTPVLSLLSKDMQDLAL